jgi:hypothetical protein
MATVSNMSLRDADQINKYEHEDSACAKRVFVVGGDFKLDIDPTQITEAVKEGLKNIEIKGSSEMSTKEIQIEKIEIPIIVKEIEIVEIEKQIIVIEHKLETIEIEKPIIQERVVTVEKPIFIPTEPQIITIEIPQIVEKIVEKTSINAIAIIVIQAAVIAFLILK